MNSSESDKGESFRNLWKEAGVPDALLSEARVLRILCESCGWRKHPMVVHPVMMHPDISEELIKKDPEGYAHRLEGSNIESVAEDSYRYLRPICRLSWESSLIPRFIEAHIPFVIENSRLIPIEGNFKTPVDTDGKIAKHKSAWSTENLSKMLQNKYLDVYESPNRYFRYWNRASNTGPYQFKDPTKKLEITFEELLKRAKAQESKSSQADGSRIETKSKTKSGEMNESSKFYYLQESLSGHPNMAEEFVKWNWDWLLDLGKKFGWGVPDRNILLSGMKGCSTPAHYDEQENIYCQLYGHKEVYLWHPGDWKGMYAFPVNHACDRQSMVNPDSPDLGRFPMYRNTRPHHIILRPGDLLYLPVTWWHHFRNLDDFAVSVTFWSKQPRMKLEDLKLPLLERQLMTVRRNLEEMIFKMFGQDALIDLGKEISNSAREKWEAKGSERTRKVKEFMIRCLSNFISTKACDAFLIDMIKGRYDQLDCHKWIQYSDTDRFEW
mmetsp:Transcript_11319/g.16918  ORF Transcript_11319/g.16918 Transcript_11319/m.16918 type:complete len:495 (-) Transcript_11319:94-1578(-)